MNFKDSCGIDVTHKIDVRLKIMTGDSFKDTYKDDYFIEDWDGRYKFIVPGKSWTTISYLVNQNKTVDRRRKKPYHLF